MNIRKIGTLVTALAFSFCLIPPSVAQPKRDLKASHNRLVKQIRTELMMLSNYSLFDILEFEITGVDTVVLSGQVTRPTLKDDAEKAVRGIEGAGKVINKVEVLPLSPEDDRIRVAVYRAIAGKQGLDRYMLRAAPPIHIIVKNGNITLVGNVATQADKDLAGIAARGIPGTFAVVNNLRVEK